ncbi:sulfur carrier protein ThiS [Virgibacillus alimentarius]|uniref:Sulfur carrier protein n=1 Tax=Virgibacillus alimentarius TaxID=698769 RepID=A0ABS4S5T9_9BACI|nr:MULTISPECIES: sulfur carrier protein ThiS [Virgibacillus]MBP2256841.1 sulfur carrier protein [Virgibacillus alimentarius]HLR69523.1 sulfur carrier protein ThiS [Virgibacillus sp.]
MNLRVNGEVVTVPDSVRTIKGVIDHFNINNPVIIVEHNDTILDKNAHEKTQIFEGDKIELVQFVGGG